MTRAGYIKSVMGASFRNLDEIIERIQAFQASVIVMAERMLLTIGGCAANAAVDLVKMGVRVAVVGRVGGDVFGRHWATHTSVPSSRRTHIR